MEAIPTKGMTIMAGVPSGGLVLAAWVDLPLPLFVIACIVVGVAMILTGYIVAATLLQAAVAKHDETTDFFRQRRQDRLEGGSQ